MTIVGVPKEIKNHEYRVGATPAVVTALVQAGHKVLVETMAGAKIGYGDDLYAKAGAEIVSTAQEVYAKADMIVKVKEPQAAEFPLLREGQILFTYLHLAPDPVQTKALLERGVIGIAYETVTDAEGRLPLLTPMSEIAGRIAIQAGATALQIANGGKGVLLGGVAGVSQGKVIVIGGGVVGTESARMALGLGADVTVLDTNLSRLRALDALYGPRLKTLYSSPAALEDCLKQADLVIGAVLIPGKLAPKLITKQHLRLMSPGTVIVDVAIDQGGCAETSRPTSHSEPTYTVDGVLHYCVPNMPGACARTSTQALTNATMSYALRLANKGYKQALKEDKGFKNGLNVCLGKVCHPDVAHDLGLEYHPFEG
ncbi:MAG: alanine dehydrogenase [Verrucomicrobia bacterium]|nr:alanine dehydrogenase [Verrucomicrobiota bacterium]MBS0635873.1 alanine dehydrogenase [Verrucomicrobiota bacterium]